MWGFPTGEGEGESVGDGSKQARGLHRLQIHKVDPIAERTGRARCCFNRQPRLAYAARTDNRQQTAIPIAQPLGHASEFLFAADERGCLPWEMMLCHHLPIITGLEQGHPSAAGSLHLCPWLRCLLSHTLGNVLGNVLGVFSNAEKETGLKFV